MLHHLKKQHNDPDICSRNSKPKLEHVCMVKRKDKTYKRAAQNEAATDLWSLDFPQACSNERLDYHTFTVNFFDGGLHRYSQHSCTNLLVFSIRFACRKRRHATSYHSMHVKWICTCSMHVKLHPRQIRCVCASMCMLKAKCLFDSLRADSMAVQARQQSAVIS